MLSCLPTTRYAINLYCFMVNSYPSSYTNWEEASIAAGATCPCTTAKLACFPLEPLVYSRSMLIKKWNLFTIFPSRLCGPFRKIISKSWGSLMNTNPKPRDLSKRIRLSKKGVTSVSISHDNCILNISELFKILPKTTYLIKHELTSKWVTWRCVRG